MLKFYTTVEAGWNYCLTKRRQSTKRLMNVLRRISKERAKDVMQFLMRCMKLDLRRVEYKVILVLKYNMLYMRTCSSTEENLRVAKDPDIVSKDFDVLIIQKGEVVQLEYSVVEHEMEYCYIRYESL